MPTVASTSTHTFTDDVAVRHGLYESTAEFNTCEAVSTLLGTAFSGENSTCPVAGFDAPAVSVSSGGRFVTVDWPYSVSANGSSLLLTLTISHNKSRGTYHASVQFQILSGDFIRSLIVTSPDHVLGSSMVGYEAAPRFNRKKFVAYAQRVVREVVSGNNAAFNARAERADEALQSDLVAQ